MCERREGATVDRNVDEVRRVDIEPSWARGEMRLVDRETPEIRERMPAQEWLPVDQMRRTSAMHFEAHGSFEVSDGECSTSTITVPIRIGRIGEGGPPISG